MITFAALRMMHLGFEPISSDEPVRMDIAASSRAVFCNAPTKERLVLSAGRSLLRLEIPAYAICAERDMPLFVVFLAKPHNIKGP